MNLLHDNRVGRAVRRPTRRTVVGAGVAGFIAGALPGGYLGGRRGSAQEATPATATNSDPLTSATASEQLMIDIGGRSIYGESSGAGGPTVVLLTGYRTSGRYWTDDLLSPDTPRQMVTAGVASFARVFTYDRPGTYAEIRGTILASRSDVISQPRTATDVVEELHAVLTAAAVPGPYVLAAHSLGGFFARLYAATYPDEVAGMVLVDSYSELLEDVMSPEQFATLKALNQAGGTDTVFTMDGYGDVETLGWGADNNLVRAAVAASPLPPMPLAVLAHGAPFPLAADAPFSSDDLEAILLATNERLATLVPGARFWIASESGHDIHQDQPELVIEAIRQVVTGVRQPDTWADLDSCCAP